MKIKFNLQPWRENVRKAQQQRFIAVTVLVMLCVCALCGLNYYIETNYLDEQSEAKDLLQNEINTLRNVERKVTETKALIEEVNNQISSIETLQNQRGIALKVLNHIASETPDTVFLNSISFNGTRLVITGIAENDTGVADFMRAMETSEFLQAPVLQGIQTAGSTERYVIPGDAEIKSFTVVIVLAV